MTLSIPFMVILMLKYTKLMPKDDTSVIETSANGGDIGDNEIDYAKVGNKNDMVDINTVNDDLVEREVSVNDENIERMTFCDAADDVLSADGTVVVSNSRTIIQTLVLTFYRTCHYVNDSMVDSHVKMEREYYQYSDQQQFSWWEWRKFQSCLC